MDDIKMKYGSLEEQENDGNPIYNFVKQTIALRNEDYFYGDGLTMIEWANLIEEILPDHYREITIEKDQEKGFDYRKITILDR